VLSSGGFAISEHLDELRARLKVVFLSLLVILVLIIFLPANPSYSIQHLDQYLTLQFLAHTVTAAFLQGVVSYILPTGWNLIAASGIGEGMEIYFAGALLLTLALGMPVVAYETYKFIDPALKESERKLVYPFAVSTSVLFVAGCIFGFFVLSKFLVLALAPFLVATSITFQIDAAAFYYVIFLIVGATGVSFTSPVFVYSLIRLRVIEADFFSRNRVIIWFLIWIVTGLFLTPDGGPLLDLVIFIPIVTMVEIAVALGRHSVKNQPPRTTGKRELKCPSCGALQSSPVLFCRSCGKSIA
jgi:sec-independent protein translocase protein TatC